jgi:hypothetical protein
MSQSSWCHRHLNLTYLLALAGTLLVLFIVDIPIILSESASTEVILILVNLPVFFFSMIIVSAWILRRKDRRIWWLALLLIPYGWIGYLLLENHRRPADPLEKEPQKGISFTIIT